MQFKSAPAYPLQRYGFLPNPKFPTTPAILFQTEAGVQLYLVTREMLEQLAEDFSSAAAVTPTKSDQN